MDNVLEAFLISTLWQSTLLLVIGLVLGQLLPKRPARAHAVLLSCLLAALIAPVATTVVGNAGWGLLATGSPELLTNTPENDLRVSSFENSESLKVDNNFKPPTNELLTKYEDNSLQAIQGSDSSLNKNLNSGEAGSYLSFFSSLDIKSVISPTTLVITWCLLSMSLFVLTLIKICREWRIVCSSAPVSDARAEGIMISVAESMKISRVPAIRSTTSSFGPTIWCWGRRPVVLLSEDIRQRLDDQDLRSVICHELAHLKRRDHLSMAAGMVATILIPWHPLVWLVRRNLRTLCEKVCDQWVLHQGTPADQYAESLLNLIATRRPSIALAVSAPRKRLESRIRSILNQKEGKPMVSLKWMVTTMFVITLSVTALTLAQPGTPGITEVTENVIQDEGATSQPEQPTGLKVISTDEMQNHLVKVRKALEGVRLEYTWTQYQGKGTMPENWMEVGDVHLAYDRTILRNGEMFHKERLLTAGMAGYGYNVGVSSVETWDGWLNRSLTHLPKEVAEERNGVRGTNQNPASITDTPWHSYSGDELDPYWQSLALKLPRVITLAEVLNHSSMTGPYLLDDGRTEWQVDSPNEWAYESATKTKLLLIGERTETGICLSEISHQFRRRDTRVERRYIFSKEVFSKDIPIPLWARYVGMQSRVGNDPSWFNTEIVLKDAIHQKITDATFTLAFPSGAAVFDSRYQMSYEVDDTVIGFARRREGAILTNEPVNGDVGENLATWLANGKLEDPGPRDDLIPIGVDDLDLPADHKHDFGEVKNMNWGSGKGHVFKVTNNTDKPVTIKEIKTSGKPIRQAYIGYVEKPPSRSQRTPGGITGIGTTLKPGETVNMQVTFSFGGGLWRHGVTLITDTGEEWKYQLSATGVVEPRAETFIRHAPEPGSKRIPVGVRLFTGKPENGPITLIEPEGIKLEFDQWITLLPFHFVAGAPMRQIGRATLDFSEYEGEFPCTVKATTPEGVELNWGIYGSGE